MSETAKTCAFITAGVVAIALAAYSDSSANIPSTQALVGTILNEDIDLAAPRSLQIAKFDRQTAEVLRFEVAEIDGVWSIPSKENYPADATEQMAAAATCLMDRKILRIAGESAQSHEEFGVVDPLSAKLDSKSAGVGAHVTMTDAADAVLVDMIIGKAVKDNPTQRYVRRANQDVVYIVDLDPSKLSTNFEDWIEDDLMQLNVSDLRKVFINDYSADLSIAMTAQGLEPRIRLDPRNEMTLVRKDDAGSWEMASITKSDPQTRAMTADALAADEEVNQDSVKGLVDGLDQLLIVDVARKPAGLSADLKAGEAFLTEEEAVSDLVQKGFIPGRQAGGADMLSSEGEVVCTLRNGVEYVLRFGQLKVQTESGAAGETDEAAAEAAAATADAAAAGADAAKGDEEKTEGEGENLRRYLFVMARFNEGAVEAPTYKELPALPPENAADAAPSAEGNEAAAGESSDASSEATDAASTDAATDEADASEGTGASNADAAADGEATDESADKSTDEGEKSDADADADADAEATKDEKEEETKADVAREAIIAQRKEIEQENDRLREEYEALISSGQEKVTELNARFGDWYFVISNDVYKKIHLGRDKAVKKKAPPAGEGTAGATGGDGAAAPSATEGLPDLPDLGGATQ